MGSLWAQGGAGTISASATGTAATGGDVAVWTSGTADWAPVQDTVGVIDSDYSDDDGDGRGIATVKVPAAPAGSYRLAIYLIDPNENVQAYSYFNICVKVSAAVSSSDSLAESAISFSAASSIINHDNDGSQEADDCQILNAEKGFISFRIGSGDGTLVDSGNHTSNHPSYAGPDARAFNIGIQSGSFFTKDAANQDHLSPEFTIEVTQG